MKKNTLFITGTLLAALLLTACSSEKTSEEALASEAESSAATMQSDAADAQKEAAELAKKAEEESAKKLSELNK